MFSTVDSVNTLALVSFIITLIHFFKTNFVSYPIIYFSTWCYELHWFLPVFSVINLCKCSYAYFSCEKTVLLHELKLNETWIKNHNVTLLKMFYIDVLISYDVTVTIVCLSQQ